MQPIEQFFPELSKPFKGIITCHQKPDGDAMGSSLALYHFLKSMGHDVKVIAPTNWAPFLDWMPDVNEVIEELRKKVNKKKTRKNRNELRLKLKERDFKCRHSE